MTILQFTLYGSIAVLIQSILLVIMKRGGVGTLYLYLLIIFHVIQITILIFTYLIPAESAISLEIICTLKPGGFIRRLESAVWIATFCCAILSIFTDEIVKGFKPVMNTVTAIHGDYFWVRPFQGILTILTASLILFREWLSLNSDPLKKHCLFLLTSYSCYTSLVVGVVYLMKAEIHIGFSMLFPLGSTFSLSLIVYGGFKYGWVSVENTDKLQYQDSYKEQLNDIFDSYVKEELSFNKATDKIPLNFQVFIAARL